MDESRRQQTSFERAGGATRSGIVAEFWAFLRESKKWWMLPIIVALICLAVFALLASTPIAPFIYTLF
jgi:drug/metabolite transporter superfamily protein YnfA